VKASAILLSVCQETPYFMYTRKEDSALILSWWLQQLSKISSWRGIRSLTGWQISFMQPFSEQEGENWL